MGGCVGTQSGGRRNSGSNSGLSDSSLAPVTKNKPLKVKFFSIKSMNNIRAIGLFGMDLLADQILDPILVQLKETKFKNKNKYIYFDIIQAERMQWKSDIPLTDGQLISKRDEFWDTAPAFEGLI